jgi:hypothetical protein
MLQESHATLAGVIVLLVVWKAVRCSGHGASRVRLKPDTT